MEDDTDIYEDLPSIEIKTEENFVANQTESNSHECAELNKQIAELTVKLDNFRKINKNLEVNLASLLKTAKAEITRKDKMIGDLRKQLDDIMFKRGAHVRTNSRVCKPTFVDNVAVPSNWQKTGQISLPPNQSRHDLTETDSSYSVSNNSNLTKTTLTPLTVFGERLLKRIAEEQSKEKRGKQTSRFCSNNSSISTTDGYVIESDKENGSVTDVTSSCTKEIQLSVVKEHPEKGGESNGIDPNTRFQQTSTKDVDAMDIVEEKRNNDRERATSRKHVKKYDVRELVTKLKNNETHEDVNGVYKRDHTEHNRYSCTEQKRKRHGHRTFTDEARTSQDETDEHISKKHCRSVERSSSTMDDYRSSSVERHRIRQREDGRTSEMRGDRRSHKRHPSCEKFKEEKYSRNKCNQYNSYREKSVRRYDVGSNSLDGSKAAKRELRDSRNTEKSEKSVRSTSKRSDRHEDCESQFQERLKSVDRAIRRDKSTKQQDNGTKHSSHGKLTNRTRHSEILKSEKISEVNKHLERTDRNGFTENDETSSTTKDPDSSQKPLVEQNKNSKRADVNDVTLDSSNYSSNKRKRERSEDRWTNGDHKSKSFFVSVEAADTNIVSSTVTTTNVENNESVENLENIEKFIRNYNADSNHFENSLDAKDEMSKTAKEHVSTTSNIFEDESNVKKQCDTIRVNSADSVETDMELKTKDVFRQVLQDSAKENEMTTEVIHEPSVNVSVVCNNSTLCETHHVVEIPSVDLTDDKASINTNIEEVLVSNSDGNGNGNDNDNDNDNHQDKDNSINIAKNTVIDKIKSNSNDGVINVDIGNDDSYDNDHDQHQHRNQKGHGNVNVHKKSVENDRNMIINEEETNKEVDSENSIAKLDKGIDNEEGQVEKETKECGKAVIKEVSRETEKTPINNDGTNGKNTSTKLQGKIVVFARRKKPVCLANNNANMTVLINNSNNVNAK
ncbi:FLICE-associated huge protein [Augochlora pura]